ncbi:MAG: hypothetical protein UHN47_05750 [Lachnospiraceae bacterium]|nr:hypothetical protein [Lachnospiraceae bacterium]
MINACPMYLVQTSNKQVADLFQAKRGMSLITKRTILSGLMLNIHENGLVTTTDGKALFKMSHIKKIKETHKAICITTANSIYQFVAA